MQKNIGTLDKLIRFIIAITIGILHYYGIISGTLGIALLVIAVLLLISVLMSFCPLCKICGFSTCKSDKKKE